MIRVLLLSRYDRLGASSRLRSNQYLPYLSQAGLDVTVAPLFCDDYVRGLYNGSISKRAVLKAYFSRLRFIFYARQFDLVWLEYEMLPWLPSWIELALLPKYVTLLVDYDDAIFHRYDQHQFILIRKLLGQKIDALMRRADIVTVGNDYLAEHARQAGARRIEWLPTVVDVDRYATSYSNPSSPITIGWIGSPNTARYLKFIAPVLRHLVATNKVRVVAVGANVTQLSDFPIEIKTWSEESEVAEIQQFDIGIMPLPDEPFEHGKCGYKLVQYMACGKPVVASPVGVNAKIVREGVNGFLASSVDEWEKYLGLLCGDAELRNRLGRAGREQVERDYSLQVASPRLENLLRSAMK